MVKVREDKPLNDDGSIDLEKWVAHLETFISEEEFDTDLIVGACRLAERLQEKSRHTKNAWSHRSDSYHTGLEMAIILAELKLDLESIVAAILYRSVREGKISLEKIEQQFGFQVSELIDGVLKMAAISELKSSVTQGTVLGQSANQLENLRKMLVAMVDDVRVALIKIAERTCAIRALKEADQNRRRKVAREIFDIYAPLAHRLGIGQLKWELEDLSFRYLEPDDYKRIAKLLDERRLDRQQYIENVLQQLSDELENIGIKAEISGRAKHIYSIWRKMRQKGIDFSEVYDVRAVRILTSSVKDCYMAIGVVHGLWQHIPKEFDDYIATPKENGYRSLHTAVIGPEGKALEVQIRTHEMHEEAELGICAHWRYKENPKSAKEKGNYEDKIAWLRQVLEWQEELGEDVLGSIADQFSHAIIDERIYVFTPDGHVVDLMQGATPLDFAYHVHTEVGHNCRGAKINGKIVPLTYALKTGEQVEILTTKHGGPSRDWMNQGLGYIQTSRARAKVQHWFKLQDKDKNIHDGKIILSREFHRLAISNVDYDKLAPNLNVKTGDDVLSAVGSGDLKVSQVLNAVQKILRIDVPEEEKGNQQLEFSAIPYPNAGPSSISVQGVDNILTHIAKCCKPVPGDQITGYITIGRGVTIHRLDCSKLHHLRAEEPDRVVDINWGADEEKTYPVDISITAYDRQGLLRDITVLLANEKINLIGVQSRSDGGDNIANMTLTMKVTSLQKLGRVLAKISQLPNVIDVHRYQS